MSKFKVLATNHTGIVVASLDPFLRMMTELLDYEVVARGPRDVANQSKVTGHPDAKVEIAYLKGGNYLLEIICYDQTEGTAAYKPRPVDIGHWHLSINVEDIEALRAEAPAYGLAEIGQKITVNAGPNQGNQILYLSTPEGVILEFTQLRR